MSGDERPPIPPARINWKGTQVCLEFVCPACGSDEHIDDWFAYYVECANCSAVWQLGDTVEVTRASPDSEPRIYVIPGERRTVPLSAHDEALARRQAAQHAEIRRLRDALEDRLERHIKGDATPDWIPSEADVVAFAREALEQHVEAGDI